MPNAHIARSRHVSRRRHYAIVASRYNHEFVQGLVEFAKREFTIFDPAAQVSVQSVPGAFEIPIAVQEIALLGNVDAIIAFGVIWEGKTAHADLIASSVTDALQRLALQHRIPIINQVLQVKTEKQANERCWEDGSLNRGIEAARAAARMVDLMMEFKQKAK